MDIGLYMLKYPFRKMIGFLMVFFKDSNPNNISWFLLLVGLAMAGSYAWAFTHASGTACVIAILLGFLRMILSTLDGMVAVEQGKSTITGDVINRMTPEICDLMLYPTLVVVSGHLDLLGVAALAMSWAISYFGILGAASGCPVQSVGPAGQTDRLAALMTFTLFQAISFWAGRDWHMMDVFFAWVLVGGTLTLALRLQRTFKVAQMKDSQHGK